MPAISNERRLAAIMVADVVGYSRLMAEDEDGTLSRLKEFRSRLFNPSVAQHGGRIVKLMGDGALVEFASVTAAVECAEMIRSLTSNNNVKVRPDQRIELRIGISLGDVIVDGADIYGDGVNIAARLEGVADTGEILVSGPAYDQAMTFVRVDWDDFRRETVVTSRNVPRRSTLILLRGDKELGRIVAGTSKKQIQGLMDLAL